MKERAKLAAAFAELDRLYATLPAIACRKECGASCGPIPLTEVEARRLHLATHVKPRTIGTDTAERCVYLSAADRCTVHDIRPLICRVWGMVRMMSCFRGCVPDRWLTDAEFVRLAQSIERIGGGRIIRTANGGLVHTPGDSFASLGEQLARMPAATAERVGERTRGLRALHGGRIIMAIYDEEKPTE